MVEAFRPGNTAEALRILSEHTCIVMAGGTDLMVHRGQSRGFTFPLLFIDHLEELKKTYRKNDAIHIGAAVPFSDMERHADIPDILKMIIRRIASLPTRNMATLGGNICNASPAADTLPYLYAVNASVVIRDRESTKTIPVREFITGVKKTQLKNNELLTEIIIPDKEFGINVYRKIGQRKGMSLSKAAFLGMADKPHDVIRDIHIALASVAPTIVFSTEIEKQMINKNSKEIDAMKNRILDQYAALIRPIDDARSTAKYRKQVSLFMIKHFLEKL
ncbi:MAG: FAD binding domain-containing protein [Candidatus Marinimicrobia bacterium]|nr:FAD binding domain-containing protein [Candidatus Neomarinimicrobiota bacterium]